LTLAISHLSEFSASLQHQKQDDAAQKIVSWLRVILDAIEVSDTPDRRTHTQQELAKMQHGLVLTNRVEINSIHQRKIPEQVVKIRRKSSRIIFDKWKIAPDTTSWVALDENSRDVTGSFSALRLEPLDMTSASPVAAFFGERTDHLCISVLHPCIFAYRRVPNSSKVFNVVEADNVTGLMRLLAQQEATTRDLDEESRSLLHVSTFRSPKRFGYG
jgi:hypothetical protein